MAFDFPASPAANQEFTPAGGPTYVFKSPVWKRKPAPSGGGGGGGAATSVSDAPPASPTAGQLWYESDSGNTFIWYDDGDTQQWVQVNAATNLAGDFTSKSYVDTADALRVLKSGDTMTGDLTISKVTPVLVFEKGTSGAAIRGRNGGLDRWRVDIGDGQAESGGNVGSEFSIVRYNDAGVNQGSALAISRATGAVSLAGDLTVKGATHGLAYVDTGAAGMNSGLWLKERGLTRWALYKHGGAESSGNAGSNFYIQRYDDAGNQIDIPFQISRQTGQTYLTQLLQLTSGQIKFPATANPSTDANTLDDYREGSWVPQWLVAGSEAGVTYGSVGCQYTKVGRLVTINGDMSLANKGAGTGAVTIGGLPFPLLSVAGGFNVSYASNLASALMVGGFITSSIINLYTLNAISSAQFLNTNAANNTRFIFSASYYTGA